jgi:hypothetical protein
VTRPIGAPAVVTLRVLEALGLADDYERAQAVLAHTMARQLPRLSTSDIREVLDKIAESDRVAGTVPAPRGSEHYVRDEAADPGDGGRRYRGPGIGGVVDGGELVDEPD